MLTLLSTSLLLFVLEFVSGETCPEPILLYETLKCQPIYASANDKCPKAFDCPHVRSRNDGKCHFNGNIYVPGQNLNDSEIYGHCFIDCTCIDKRSGGTAFGCISLDCAEKLRIIPKKGCHFRHDLNKCCTSDEVCPPFRTRCLVNGAFLYEGQKFNPPNQKCTTCVCREGFVTGKFEPPFCKRRECLDEITHALDVKRFCAPVYVNRDDCCPKQWICPRNDNVISSAVPSKSDGSLQCKFGDKDLNVGDAFERTHYRNGAKVRCECRIPPYVTCIQDENYPYNPGDYH